MRAHYSHQSGYTITRRPSRRPSVRTVQRRVKLGPTTAKFIGLAVLAILAIVMLAQRSSSNATDVYNQQALSDKISQVKESTDQLLVEEQRAKTLAEIQHTSQDLQMQTATQFEPVGESTQATPAGQVAGVSTQKP